MDYSRLFRQTPKRAVVAWRPVDILPFFCSKLDAYCLSVRAKACRYRSTPGKSSQTHRDALHSQAIVPASSRLSSEIDNPRSTSHLSSERTASTLACGWPPRRPHHRSPHGHPSSANLSCGVIVMVDEGWVTNDDHIL
jgi:hypothetical protein